ncbi:MAG TPA: glutamine synthetase family protein [Kineosporiaceae bacterium]|nr:glutamine synthetase family protein [Kineosporiaceae bacterium]
MADGSPPLTIARLRELVQNRDVDTVIVAFTDMQGRLQGKRMHARFFLDDTLDHGTEACNYLLAVDVDMNTVGGYEISSWDQGYGDFVLRPDLDTLRPVAWMPSSVLVQCDLLWLQGDPVRQSPRQILLGQTERAAGLGLMALAGTELEFQVFDTSYEQAWDSGYRGLVPATRYNIDYSILGTSRVEPLLRDIRNTMFAAGMVVESAKGECNLGQHEIAFRYADVVTTADQHSVYKTAAKEIAAKHGKALSFMAKFDHREGNSCHIHLSLRGLDDDAAVFAGDRDGRSPLFEHFIAGILTTMREFTLLYAPNINSYQRFKPGSFAPTAVAWGLDNRTCAVRVVGAGKSLRLENRVPGGDVNPYLAIAGMLAGGLYGIEHEIPLENPLSGNGYEAQKPRVPTTLAEARDLFAGSDLAKLAFGEDVVRHYTNAADVEIKAFEAAGHVEAGAVPPTAPSGLPTGLPTGENAPSGAAPDHAGGNGAGQVQISEWERYRCFERL